jgi:hypothetical protein
MATKKVGLDFAAREGDLQEAKRLIQAIIDANGFDDLGKTLLTMAAESEHIIVVWYLIQVGADGK